MFLVRKIAEFLGAGRVREEAALDLTRLRELSDMLRDEAMFIAQAHA